MKEGADFKQFQNRLLQDFKPSEEHALVQQPDRFCYIGPFQQGVAVAMLKKEETAEKGGSYGFIDERGNTLIDFQYQGAKDFSGGLAVVAQFVAVPATEEPPKNRGWLEDFMSSFLKQEQQGRAQHLQFGFINKVGKLAIPMMYDDAFSFSEGLALVKKEGRFSLIDKENKLRHSLHCDWVPPPHKVQDGQLLISKDGREEKVWVGKSDKTEEG